MSDELQDMIQGFVEEAQENFDAIESNLLIFEENPEDKDIINGIFRVMHTIKGTAGFMGLDDIQALAHKLESIFDLFRRSELVATPEVLDTILPGIDLLKQMVLELIEAERSEYPFESTIVVLEELAKGNTKSTIQKKPEPAQPKIDTPQSVEEESNFDDDLGLEISEDILKEFVVEAEEHLVTIEENLLSLEKTPNSMESINELFRAIHSIKGTSDYVRLPKITTLSHSLETIFDRIRKGKSLQYTAELADMVLKSIDLLRTLVFMVKMGDDDTIISIDEQLEQLSQFLGNEKEDEKPAKNKSSSVGKSAFENLSSQQCMVIENLGMKIIESNATVNDLTTFHRSLRTLGNAAEKIGAADSTAIIKQLEDLVVSILAEETTQDSVKSSVSVLIANLITSIQGVSNGSTRTTQSKETASSQNTQNGALTPVKENEKKDAPVPSAKRDDHEIKTMRIEATRLDNFMNLIGELITARNTFNHVTGELGGLKIPGKIMRELKNVETSFNRISDDLQNSLMEMRLVSVKTVFQKIPRMVRDISRKTSKKIQLQMVGEQTAIDKSIVEMLGDPLVHIIRNSCDHGIETPEKRIAAGKPETGTIILKATHLGSAIEIAIIDDGAGINTERVRKLAVEKGMITAEEAEKLDAKTVNNFIFKPGFSTVETVSDLSGRGVGMDVVLTNIQKIQGTVDVDSEPGNGSSVRLTLPLTLAVIDALIISTEGQKFAIPLDAVKETMEVKESTLQHLKQKEAIDVRGKIIGVTQLTHLLELGTKERDPERVWSIVFIQAGGLEIGIAVDDLHTQQEIVVKPLQGYLTNIPGIKGSTILGSGEVVLILEPSELVILAAV